MFTKSRKLNIICNFVKLKLYAMKRFILTIILFVSVMLGYAQEHLRFMDIPIQGTLDSFVDILVEEKKMTIAEIKVGEGYTSYESRKLIGEFEGFKNVKINVVRKREFNHVSSVIVDCDTIEYNYNKVLSLIDKYDSIYGKHKYRSMSPFDMYRWELESGNIQISVCSFMIQVHFMDYTERVADNIRSFDDVESYKSFEERLEEERKKQTVREICGVPFGSSYDEAKRILESKYGYPEYYPDRTTISYKNKNYAGLNFDAIHFLFQSDGHKSYMSGCIFIMNANSLSEAKAKQDILYKKLSEKYLMLDGVDSNGSKYYYGGYSPLEDGSLAFTIDILKYDDKLSKLFYPYAARLTYGRYDYVKEEF